MQIPRKHVDLLRRFTPTPLAQNFEVMGRQVRVETNCNQVLSHIARVFGRYAGTKLNQTPFVWRIVADRSSHLQPPWPEMVAFSSPGLRYVNLGQRSFAAVDLESRQAAAFISEGLVQNAPGFSSVFLATLFDLTAGALDLVPISSACIARNGKALLIFGPPRSGKTTSAYHAGHMGFIVYADQAAYAEVHGTKLRVWGQFWPAAFRTETRRYLSEIGTRSRPFRYGAYTFLAFEGDPYNLPEPSGVTVTACVFLEREALRKPRLRLVAPANLSVYLRGMFPLQDDERFGATHNAVLNRLSTIPWYRLRYGGNPAEAAELYCELCEGKHSLEDPA